jgi:glycerol-3-phosphate dehydrogenase
MKNARQYLAKDPGDGDVLSVFAGLRPLVKFGGVSNTAALSRNHIIVVSESGLITITGGKWTTYRKMAEDVVDRAEMVAGLDNRRSLTETLPIHGWTHEAIGPENLQPYGADAASIASLIQAEPALAAPLHPRLPYQRGEVLWHARHEMARTVEDVLARRTRALLLDSRASIEAAPGVAELLALELGRDSAWREAQAQTYAKLAQGYVYTDPASKAAGTPG